MLIWMIDSLLLYRKVMAGLVPPNLLISHGIPVSSGSNPEVVTTQIKKGQDQPRTQRKKKRKKKKEKKREEGASFANPPSEDPLVDEPS